MYNFAHDLPGGVRCGFKRRPGLATQAGTLVTGQTIFTFTTGGPSILTAIPIQDSTDEGFRGLVSVRPALAGSLEYPRSAALGLVGAEDFVQQLRRLGLDGANEYTPKPPPFCCRTSSPTEAAAASHSGSKARSRLASGVR
jgi:hypothetical protein